MRRAGRDHREAVLFLRHPDIGDYRPRRFQHFGDDLIQIIGMLRDKPLHVESVGKLHEIGQRVAVGFRIAAAMDQFLPLPHHAHPFIVDDEHLHRQVILRQR